MSQEEKIMTLHPEGRQGVNIVKARYDLIRDFILGTLEKKGEMLFSSLTELAHKVLSDPFEGKITWYVVTIKLDMEARGEITRVAGKGPQRIRLNKLI